MVDTDRGSTRSRLLLSPPALLRGATKEHGVRLLAVGVTAAVVVVTLDKSIAITVDSVAVMYRLYARVVGLRRLR